MNISQWYYDDESWNYEFGCMRKGDGGRLTENQEGIEKSIQTAI